MGAYKSNRASRGEDFIGALVIVIILSPVLLVAAIIHCVFFVPAYITGWLLEKVGLVSEDSD